MAGTGIRAYELARVLADSCDVQLAGTEGSLSPDGRMSVVEYSLPAPDALRAPIHKADVIVAQPHWPLVMGWMQRSRARLIFDLYAPELLEALETFAGHRPVIRGLIGGLITDRLMHALHIGHHFLCASEKQRDLWTGVMIGERLLQFSVYRRDPSLNDLFGIVPFGLPDQAAEPTGGPGPRQKFPGIAADDEIIIWNGGVWDWFDPLTTVEGVARLQALRPRARLVFMGAATHAQAIRAIGRTEDRARELGLLGRSVFLNDEWVPYERRADWLLQCSCAVSTHVDQLETRYSFRTRLLDCFWAGLPVVCTAGDALADRIALDDLGETVPPGDPVALAAALDRVLGRGRGEYSKRLAATAEEYRWPRAASPLVEFARLAAPATRLGDSFAGRTSLRPSQRMRWVAHRGARRMLNGVGLTHWPRLDPK